MEIEDLSCGEFIEIVTEYLDGALPPTERSRFEVHMAICSGCLRYLEQIKQTIALTGTLTEEQIAPDAKTELLSAFRDWKRNRV